MVIWSDTAKSDLRKIYDYILQDSQFYAKKVIQDIIDKSEFLSDFPEMGEVVQELNNSNIREVIIYSYRMIYQVSNTNVEILALVHARINLSLNSDN